MGIGSARGDDRAVQAAELAISSPLLEASIDGAHGVLLSIQGGSDLGLYEIHEAARLVQEAAHPEANIIFGNVIDDALGDEVRVTVIAAGFDPDTATAPRSATVATPATAPAPPPTVPSVASVPSPEITPVDEVAPQPDMAPAMAHTTEDVATGTPNPLHPGDLQVPRVFDEEPIRGRQEEDLDVPDFLR